MCKTYGYARISRKTQSIERQIANIEAKYPDAIIIKEAYTGTKIQGREKFERLCKTVKAGDTIIFDSVSRMSRNAAEGYAQYQNFFEQGVNLVFMKEPQINTDTYKKAIREAVPMTGTAVDFILEGVNKYLMTLAKEQIRLAFEQAEKEVTDLHQRTSEGIREKRKHNEELILKYGSEEEAKKDPTWRQIGQQPGRKLNVKKAAATKETIRKYSKDFAGTLDDTDVIKLAGISRNSYYKYKAELRAE